MKIKFYTKYFSFRLAICIVCYLLGACSKLGGRYGADGDEGYSSDDERHNEIVEPSDMEVDKGDESDSGMDDDPVPSPWLGKLFRAIGNDDISKVAALLIKESGLDNMREMNPKNMSICLHIAAENTGNNAVDIMTLLLDKMRPLLLSKTGRESLLCNKNKLQEFVHGSVFWDENKMQKALRDLEVQGYNNSALLWTNDVQETPLLIAAKRGSIEMVGLLLEYTHKCVGLDHTVHIDEEKNDFLDIVLEQADNAKLARLIQEVYNCSTRSDTFTCMHFSGMSKCQSEAVARAILSSKNKKKLEYLFKAVHNNKLERLKLLLDTILTILGPDACLKVFIKEYKSSKYTPFLTALNKNSLTTKDKRTVKALTRFFLSALKGRSHRLPDPLQKKMIALLSKDGTKSLESMPTVMGLIEEHKMGEAYLFAFSEALRIIEADTPSGQLWSLNPPSPKSGGRKKKQLKRLQNKTLKKEVARYPRHYLKAS